jgi:hypothetical protein
MLGEQVGDVSARITSIRVLPPDGPDMQFEVSVQGSGTFLGHQVTLLASYHQIVRADKTLFCPVGHVTLLAADGDSAYWTGFAVGRPTGKPPAARMVPCGHMRTSSSKWLRLNEVATVSEWVVGEDGTGRWKVWEWKVSESA